MKNPLRREPTALEAKIYDIHTLMDRTTPDTDEYQALLGTLKELEALKKANPSWRPSPDAVLGGVVSLAGIGAIIFAERLQILATKAWPHVVRPRL